MPNPWFLFLEVISDPIFRLLLDPIKRPHPSPLEFSERSVLFKWWWRYEPTHGIDTHSRLTFKERATSWDFCAQIDFYQGKPELQDTKPEPTRNDSVAFLFTSPTLLSLFFQCSIVQAFQVRIHIYGCRGRRCWIHQESFWWLMPRTKQMSLS